MGDNNYARYLFCQPEKEIDGLYNQNEEINLKIFGKIDLIEGIKNMEKKKRDEEPNNDLKCEIIYKNFPDNIIEKDTPIIL